MKKIYYLFTLCVLFSAGAGAQINLNTGLVAYHPFDSSFNDFSGNGNHGVEYGGVSFTTDQWGNADHAAYFDGFDDYVLVPPSTQLTPDTSFTLSFLFNTDDAINGQVLVSKSTWMGTATTQDIQYQLGFTYPQLLGGDGVFLSTAHDGNCSTTTFFTDDYAFSGTPVQASTWYSVITVFDHGVKSIYVDGVLTSQTTVSGMPNNTTVDNCSGGELKFGAWWVLDPQFYHGALDEARVYNRALNVQEVVALSKLTVGHSTESVGNQPITKNGIAIYPNPVTTILNVQFSGTYTNAAVYNNIGQLILTVPVTGNSVQIGAEQLPNGNYHLTLSGRDGTLTRAFVK
jgi:hypothetical protein